MGDGENRAAGSGSALFTGGLDSRVVSWDVGQTPRLLHSSGALVSTADHAERFGDDVVGVQPRQGAGPPADERLFDVNLRTGVDRSWPLGLADGDYVNQTVSRPDGALALVSIQQGSTANRFELWDLKRGIRIGVIDPPPAADESLALSAAISPDGKTAVVTLTSALLGVLALPSGQLKRTIAVHFPGPGGQRIQVVPWQYDPNGRLLLGAYDPGPALPGPPSSAATSSPADPLPDQRLGLLDVVSGQLVSQADLGDIDFPTAVGWSDDCSVLAVGTAAGTLTTYDARTLRLLHQSPDGDAGYVLSASFAADGRTLVTGGSDNSMRLWNADILSREGNRITVSGGGDDWWYAWFAPDGNVSGFAPQTRQVPDERWFTFPATADAWVTLACKLAGADMTPAQWTQYAADQPCQHVC